MNTNELKEFFSSMSIELNTNLDDENLSTIEGRVLSIIKKNKPNRKDFYEVRDKAFYEIHAIFLESFGLSVSSLKVNHGTLEELSATLIDHTYNTIKYITHLACVHNICVSLKFALFNLQITPYSCGLKVIENVTSSNANKPIVNIRVKTRLRKRYMINDFLREKFGENVAQKSSETAED